MEQTSASIKTTVAFLIFLNFGFLGLSQTFDLKSESLSIGDRYTLKAQNYFAFSKYCLLAEGLEELNQLAEFINSHEGYFFEIGYHKDSRGSDHSCQSYGLKRAIAIKTQLEDCGVPPQRIVAKNYGESQHIVSNQQIMKISDAYKREEAHAKNRRIEVLVVRYAPEIKEMPRK